MFVLSLLSLLPSPTQKLPGVCRPHSVSSALSLHQREPAGCGTCSAAFRSPVLSAYRDMAV